MNAQYLFDDLVRLTETSEAFYKQEFKLDDSIYWIFNYRLASYSDFQLPSAKWARGTMFEVTSSGEFIRLASLPMPKFWNYLENPSTMNLDLNEIDWIEVKSDGSLMSTYIHNGELRLKSKGSLFSEQAIDAMEWLNQPDNTELYKTLKSSTVHGNTVNLEWVSPWNRICVSYTEPNLIVLNTMDNVQIDWNNKSYTDLWFNKWMNPIVDIGDMSKKEFIESVYDMKESIEGFIFVMPSGQRVKIKTNLYCSLHIAREGANNPRRLFECVLDEGTDDLRSMFATDQFVLQTITDMESLVQGIYNHLVSVVENYYNSNKDLDRKTYAIKGKERLTHMQFGLAMNLYVGRKNDYKDFMKSHYKEFGIRDIATGKD